MQRSPVDTYLFFEEQKVWSEINLTWSYSDEEKAKGLIVASRTNTYAVKEYFKCIPSNVFASKKYKTTYVNKHKSANTTLKADMVTEKYYVLKCN